MGLDSSRPTAIIVRNSPTEFLPQNIDDLGQPEPTEDQVLTHIRQRLEKLGITDIRVVSRPDEALGTIRGMGWQTKVILTGGGVKRKPGCAEMPGFEEGLQVLQAGQESRVPHMAIYSTASPERDDRRRIEETRATVMKASSLVYEEMGNHQQLLAWLDSLED